MTITPYAAFLNVHAKGIYDSLEIIARSADGEELIIPSPLVAGVLSWLGYANGWLGGAPDGFVKAKKEAAFDEFYEFFKTTSLYGHILKKTQGAPAAEMPGDDMCGSDFYNRFLFRFAGEIYQTLETLSEGQSAVELDLSFADALSKMGHAHVMYLKDMVGYRKTPTFDAFYNGLKATPFYRDVLEMKALLDGDMGWLADEPFV